MAWLIGNLILAYLVVGVLFALYFVTFGAGRIDAAASQSTRGFRVMVFPGAMGLWPWLLWRVMRSDAKGQQDA